MSSYGTGGQRKNGSVQRMGKNSNSTSFDGIELHSKMAQMEAMGRNESYMNSQSAVFRDDQIPQNNLPSITGQRNMQYQQQMNTKVGSRNTQFLQGDRDVLMHRSEMDIMINKNLIDAQNQKNRIQSKSPTRYTQSQDRVNLEKQQEAQEIEKYTNYLYKYKPGNQSPQIIGQNG